MTIGSPPDATSRPFTRGEGSAEPLPAHRPPLPVPEAPFVPPERAGGLDVTARVVPERVSGGARGILLLLSVLAGSILAGNFAAGSLPSLAHDRMLPWILGRSLGVASYLSLTALVTLGLWLRHPWRRSVWSPRPESLLRAHVTLAAATVTLLAGHLSALALDTYAGVGWSGVFVPWHATYRPTPVALGTLACYGMVLVAGTAALAGSLGRRIWFPIHSVSAVVFALSLVHGLFAGSDSHSLRWMYVLTGAVVLVVQATRLLVVHASDRPALELE